MLKVSDFHGVKKFDCEINGMKNELLIVSRNKNEKKGCSLIRYLFIIVQLLDKTEIQSTE